MSIAERTGTDPTGLPPLYETVDPDALDRLVQREESCRVSFEYAGYDVTVAGTGRVEIHEALGDYKDGHV